MKTSSDTTHPLEPAALGAWRLSGHIGERLDRIAEARLTTEAAWNRLYPQTEAAFRLREDDRSHRTGGVWRGEFWGKYILGAIAACRYYGSADLKERIRGAVAGLLSTQDPDGYIGTYHDSMCFGPRTWNIWCRKYTLWGLLEAAALLNDDAVVEAAARFADHLLGEVGPGAHDIIRTGQFNGLPSTSILKPIVDLYRATGEKRYLAFGEYIVDQWGRHPHGPPDLFRKALTGTPIHTWFPAPETWAKSYEFLSCAEGLIELYRATGRTDYLAAATAIHRLVTDWERNPVGGVSFNDKFVGARFLANSVCEVCDVVYWNRLSFQLYSLTGDVRYIDEIERALYNGLLCGMHPDGDWGLRRFRLTHRHVPAHRHFLEGHQCCVDNAPRGLFQAAQSALFTDDAGVRITLYEAGRGTVRLRSGHELELAVRGDLLDAGTVAIAVNPRTPATFAVSLRKPFWSRATEVRVNGTPVACDPQADWCRIERTWKAGDTIDVTFDLQPRLEWFDASVFGEQHAQTPWHREQWASIARLGEDNQPPPSTATPGLTTADALPQETMAMAFTGPIALARDARLGEPDLFARLPPDTLQSPRLVATPRPAPAGIHRAYRLGPGDGSGIDVCDFASAGNTWDERSRFNAWMPVTQSGSGSPSSIS